LGELKWKLDRHIAIKILAFKLIPMDIPSIIILGIVQGVTEWIPVSSKTQVTFVYLKFLNGNIASVIPILLYVHIGTVIAATIYFRKEIAEMISSVMKKPTDFKTHFNGKVGFLFTSLLFTGVLGLPLLYLEKKVFSSSLELGWLYAIMGALLLVTGFLLLVGRGSSNRKVKDVTWRDGILTGLLQGISILPGISRDGTSTTGLIWQNFDSESSFHLSFLLSIPTVLFAEIFLDYAGGFVSFPITDGILLALVSLVVGYFVMDIVLKVVKKVNMAYVVFALGIIMIVAGLLSAG
jgi:undecaprenyl-diphosphatase